MSIDMTNEWHVLEYAVLFASHSVLSSHGGLSHFTVQNLYNIYYFFTPNLLYNVPMGRLLGYTTPMPYHLGTIRYGWCNKKEDVV